MLIMSKLNKKTPNVSEILNDLKKLNNIIEKISINPEFNNVKIVSDKLTPISKNLQKKYKKFIPKEDIKKNLVSKK